MTKISKITIGATIPTGNFSNLKVEFDVVDFTNEKEGIEYGLKYTKELFQRFNPNGELKEFKVKTSADKINAIGL